MKRILKEYIPYFIIIILVIVIKLYVITPIRVNGPSMNDTLHDKDIMILDEISYRFSSVERFDIVVVKYKDEFIIKRVIGLPGEVVSCKDNKIYINGKVIEEDFSHEYTADFNEVLVTEDNYFVLGDNRINSTDSRIIGLVSRKDIKGKTSLTILPFSRFGIKKWFIYFKLVMFSVNMIFFVYFLNCTYYNYIVGNL